VFEQRDISVMSTPKDKTRLSRRVNYGNEYIEPTAYNSNLEKTDSDVMVGTTQKHKSIPSPEWNCRETNGCE